MPEALFERGKSSGRLGPLLAWSVVFADIGTSIYYVPGILFRELGGKSPSPAAAFVLATGIAFVFLSLKYVNVAARYPDGGGVVSVASDAFGPFIGCIGGILICVDYFLTGAISSVSGFQYLAAELPRLEASIAPAACGALVLLGLLNYIGIRESALLTAGLAIASLLVNLVVLTVVSLRLDGPHFHLVLQQFSAVGALKPWTILVGFGSSWLAFSGLESISQIAPALAEPREKTALRAMLLVIACILITSPLMTAFETALLDAAHANPDQFVYELGSAYGNRAMQIAIVLTSSTLLFGASNTALIGCYHVFLALVRLGFMPRWLAERNQRFGTPHRAIVDLRHRPGGGRAGVARSDGDAGGHVLVRPPRRLRAHLHRHRSDATPGEQARLRVLAGDLHLGARAGGLGREPGQQDQGDAVRRLGHPGRLRGRLRRAARPDRPGEVRFTEAEAAEHAAAQLETAIEVVTLEEALENRLMYPSTTLVAVRAANLRLFQEALARARGAGDRPSTSSTSTRSRGCSFRQERPVARCAAGPAGGGRLLQAGRYDRHPHLAHGPRRRRVGRGRGAQARGRGGHGGHVAAQRRLAPAAGQRPQVAGQGAAAVDARLDLQLAAPPAPTMSVDVEIFRDIFGICPRRQRPRARSTSGFRRPRSTSSIGPPRCWGCARRIPSPGVARYVDPDSREGLSALGTLSGPKVPSIAVETGDEGPTGGSYSFQPYDPPEVMDAEQAGSSSRLRRRSCWRWRRLASCRDESSAVPGASLARR